MPIVTKPKPKPGAAKPVAAESSGKSSKPKPAKKVVYLPSKFLADTDLTPELALDALLAYSMVRISGQEVDFEAYIKSISDKFSAETMPQTIVLEALSGDVPAANVAAAVALFADELVKGEEPDFGEFIVTAIAGDEATADDQAAADEAAEDEAPAEDDAASDAEALIGLNCTYTPKKGGKPIKCVIIAVNTDGTLKLRSAANKKDIYGRVDPEAVDIEEPAEEEAAEDDGSEDFVVDVPIAKAQANKLKKLLKMTKPDAKVEHGNPIDGINHEFEMDGANYTLWVCVTNDKKDAKRPYLDLYVEGEADSESGETLPVAGCEPTYDELEGQYVLEGDNLDRRIVVNLSVE